MMDDWKQLWSVALMERNESYESIQHVHQRYLGFCIGTD